jgi:hypothetical protein
MADLPGRTATGGFVCKEDVPGQPLHRRKAARKNRRHQNPGKRERTLKEVGSDADEFRGKVLPIVLSASLEG